MQNVKRNERIQWLRALAALTVLVSHVAFWTGASGRDLIGPVLARGDSGVAVFFAISAYLLVKPWLQRNGNGPRSGRDYFLRRIARIMPAYFLVLGAVIAAAMIWRPEELRGSNVLAHLFLGQAYSGHSFQAFTQSWSLTTEMTFYLVLPALGWALAGIAGLKDPAVIGPRKSAVPNEEGEKQVSRSEPQVLAEQHLGVRRAENDRALSLQRPEETVIERKRIWHGFLVIGLLAAAGVTAQCLAATPRPALPALAMSVLGHAAWFAAGLGVAWLRHIPAKSLLPGTIDQGTIWMSAAALVYLLMSTPLGGPVNLSRPEIWQVLGKESLYALFALCLILAATAPVTNSIRDKNASWEEEKTNGHLPANSGTESSGQLLAIGTHPLLEPLKKIMTWLGEISYGIFLWHVLLLQILFAGLHLQLFTAPFGLSLIVILLGTVPLAAITYRRVEQPAIRWSHQHTR